MNTNAKALPLKIVVASISEYLASHFPICCYSDEFFYFPQVQCSHPPDDPWDNFSKEFIENASRRLTKWESQLLQAPIADENSKIDRQLWIDVITTLQDHLQMVKPWEYQPTFHLTIATIGVATVLDCGARRQIEITLKKLPSFLNRAGRILKRVPKLFMKLGLDMVCDCHDYFAAHSPRYPQLKEALKALEQFKTTLLKKPLCDDFLLPPDVIFVLLEKHLRIGMQPREIESELKNELNTVRQNLATIVSAADSKISWPDIIRQMPFPQIRPESGLTGLYRQAVNQLEAHCIQIGLVSSSFARRCGVRVSPVPKYLSAIRSASSYSIAPQSPPSGGTFYIINADDPSEWREPFQREYRILCAHETYPGHHLLDSHRWAIENPLRRPIEAPLFYEGWACFSEMLMHYTGFFKSTDELICLLRRRWWRAVRGKIDLGLQTGLLTLEGAAEQLTETGMSPAAAMASARRYPLNPGYQLCYSLGLRRFLSLYNRHANDRPDDFAQSVLYQGEIGFDQLEHILANRQNMGQKRHS